VAWSMATLSVVLKRTTDLQGPQSSTNISRSDQVKSVWKEPWEFVKLPHSLTQNHIQSQASRSNIQAGQGKGKDNFRYRMSGSHKLQYTIFTKGNSGKDDRTQCFGYNKRATQKII
jgi:hypothetical protein